MQCPSCGDAFNWHDTFAEVVTCTSCRGVSRVQGDKISLAGQSAQLIASNAGLVLGVVGSFKNVAFSIVGRVRYAYSRGFWDEWCAHTAEGELVWITEDDGTLSRSRNIPFRSPPDSLNNLKVGRSVFVSDHDYLVEEIGRAKCLGTEGQLPFSAIPGDEIDYIALRAGQTQFGTIERYDGEVHFYEGQKLKLRDLNLVNPASQTPTGPSAGFDVASADPSRIGCFSCGAPVTPQEQKSTVACDFCGIENATNLPQVDCSQCNTRFGLFAAEFMTQAQCPKCLHGIHIETQGTGESIQCFTKSADLNPKPAGLHKKGLKPFRLGQEATFSGKSYVLTGHVRNEVFEDGLSYYSDSFHLLAEDGDVRWLDCEDGHYVLSEKIGPIPEELLHRLPKTKVTFNGREYQAFDAGDSSVCCVQGQLSYEARVGDKVSYYDFIAPPHTLSAEVTDQENEGFAGRYVPLSEIAAAFKVPESHFKKPTTVAPSQPYIETTARKLVRVNLPFYVLFFLSLFLFSLFKGTYLGSAELQHNAYEPSPVLTTEPFEVISTPTTVALSIDTSVDNSWVYVDTEFLDASDNIVHVAAQTISYYHGTEGGESWSEGSDDHTFLFRVQEPGTYRFKIRTEGDSSTRLMFKIEQGVWLSRYPLIALIVFGLAWLINALHRRQFESSRWEHLEEDDD